MRIAIASDWFAPRQGGIESQLVTLAERLAERGHEVTVITSTPAASNGAGYTVRRLDGPRLPGVDVAISPTLLRELRDAIGNRADVVHAHVSVVSPVGYLAALAAVSQRTPTVLTFHSVLRLKRLALSAVNALARLDQRPLVWSAVSELVAGQVARAIGGREVAILPNGIDLEFWRDASGSTTPGARPVTLICAMRLHRKKRPRELVAAFGRAVAQARRPARLVIAGDGPELPALRRDAETNSAATVELVGWQDKTSLRRLYAQADAFVLPSRHEAFGIAALEARAAGLPVIALRSAGCREFLRHGENALLCDDDAGLVHAMARIVCEPDLRRRLRADGGALVRYDWDAVLAGHERMYDLATRASARGLVPATAPAWRRHSP